MCINDNVHLEYASRKAIVIKNHNQNHVKNSATSKTICRNGAKTEPRDKVKDMYRHRHRYIYVDVHIDRVREREKSVRRSVHVFTVVLYIHCGTHILLVFSPCLVIYWL